MRPLSCSESRWVYALKICIEERVSHACIVLYCSALLSGGSHDPPRFRRACPIGHARSLSTSGREEKIEMGHGSVEPDNSGGTVDIEGFFLRYAGIEPPLPIQKGRQHRSGGVKDTEAGTLANADASQRCDLLRTSLLLLSFSSRSCHMGGVSWHAREREEAGRGRGDANSLVQPRESRRWVCRLPPGAPLHARSGA
jgi:hypothetical protein